FPYSTLLRSDRPDRAVDFAQNHLDSHVFQIGQVVEHEHLVLDALSQIGVLVAQHGDDLGFLGVIHGVEDLGSSANPAQFAAFGTLSRHDTVEHVGQLVKRRRLHAPECGNTGNDVIASALGQQGEYGGRAVALQVHQDGGNDLRVFLADQFGNGRGLQVVQGIDAVGRGAIFQDVLKQARGTVSAKRAGEDFADVGVRTHRNRQVLFCLFAELNHDLV